MTLTDYTVRIDSPYRLHGAFGVDISESTVTVTLHPPSGSDVVITATIEDAATGTFYADVTAAQNAVAGDWIVYAEAKIGAVVVAATFAALVRVVSKLTIVTT